MYLCRRCEHFIGLDIDGYVWCRILGRVRPMIACRHFKKKEESEGDRNG